MVKILWYSYPSIITIGNTELKVLKILETHLFLSHNEILEKLNQMDNGKRKNIYRILKGLGTSGRLFIFTQQCHNKKVLCYYLNLDGQRLMVYYNQQYSKELKNKQKYMVKSFSAKKSDKALVEKDVSEYKEEYLNRFPDTNLKIMRNTYRDRYYATLYTLY